MQSVIRELLGSVEDALAVFDTFFGRSPVPLQLYDAAGRSKLVNEAFIRLFGSQPPPDYSILEDDIARASGIMPLIERAFRSGETVVLPPTWYDPRELTSVKVSEGRRVAVTATLVPVARESELRWVVVAFEDVTAQLLLRPDEDRDLLAAIVEQTADGIIVCDEKGVIRVFNPAAQRQHGVGKREVGPEEWTSAYGLHAESEKPLPLERTPLYRALQGERVENASWLVRRPDGTLRRLTGTATPLRRRDGTPAGAVVVTRDETERLAAMQRASLQIAVTRAIAGSASFGDAMVAVLRDMCSVLGWEYGEFFEIDPEAAVLRPMAFWSTDEALRSFIESTRPLVFARGIGMPGAVWDRGKPLWFADYAAARFPRAEAARRAGLASAFGFPVRFGDEVIGVIEFFTSRPTPPDEALIEVFHAAGAQIGELFRRLRAQEDVARSEALKASILDTALDCVIMIDHRGQVVDWNASSERTFGWTRQEAVGRLLAELIIPERYRHAHLEGLRRFVRTGVGPVIGRRVEIEALRRDGTEFPVELTITSVTVGDDPPFFTGYLRDITERRAAEAERQRLLEEAQSANRLKDEFLATVSHELRTPLHAMLGWAQMLKGGAADPARVAKAADVIERNLHLQTRLVEDLLDVSRIITGKLRLDVKLVDLRDIVRAAIDTVAPAAAAKHIVLDASKVPPTPIHGDATRLQQIAWNLLSNAIKFTPDGGRVSVSITKEDGRAALAVADTGQGLPPSFLPFAFDAFRQADASTTRQHGGLGLGLAIVKRLAELHGGTVSARSDGIGKGATFVVTLPTEAT